MKLFRKIYLWSNVICYSLLIFWFDCSLYAQQSKTTIHGKVLHAITREPIPYATITVKNTQIGTVTDNSGTFHLSTYNQLPSDSIKISSIGFDPAWYNIILESDNILDVWLVPSDYSLSEVVILPDEKENPAYPFMRKVLAQKESNNPENVISYQCEVYNKIEIDLFDVDEQDKDRLTFKPFQVLFDYVDTTEEKPCIPVFFTETLSDFFYYKKTCSPKERIKASRMSGIKSESVTQLLGTSYQKVNVYDNNLILFKKSFVSPLSKACFRFYRFNMMDSIIKEGVKTYKITFKPKRRQELTFEGHMWIQDSTFVLEQIDAHMADEVNLNFISDFSFSQKYRPVQGDKWMLVQDSLFVLAKMFLPHEGKSQEFLAKKATSYQDYLIDEPKKKEFYQGSIQAVVADDVHDKSESYWESARHQDLSLREENIYELTDSLKNLPVVKLLKTFGRGYYQMGPIELGPFFSTYSFNNIEGHRIRLGGRTTNRFSTWSSISAYGAYGFRDERLKFGTTIQQLISKKPLQMFEVGYQQDVEQLGTTSGLPFRTDNLFNALLRRSPANRLNLVSDFHISFQREWFPGFSHTFEFRRRELTPLGILNFEEINHLGQVQSLSEITTSEWSVHMHLRPKEQFLSSGFDRVSLGSKFPSLDIVYSRGVKDLWGGDYQYDKLLVHLRYNTKLGRLGKLDSYFQGGKIWGAVPFPLLEIHKGNETLILNERAFNTMNFFEFASDRFAQGAITWHLDGLIFNKIPLFRKLKFREVLGAKTVVGSISDENRETLILPDFTSSLDTPFAEASAGIENIFRILRLDAIWRLTHKDHPGIVTFGVRGKLDFRF